MIVQIQGNVKFPITLDPTVWIFDDRKQSFEEVFHPESVEQDNEAEEELKRKSQRFDREVYQQKLNPPVNKSLHRKEKERILTESFMMPIKPFIHTSEPDPSVSKAVLITENGEHTLQADRFAEGLLLFSKDGKPLKEDGPVHLYFTDEGDQQEPIKGIRKIIFQ
ncbi:hypothetical protein GCM10010954_08380 [Halobacillus andaensis]|uniref:Peptidyl-prolyl cis-trans isomerase n=1 Tax=Halobacillus andaensis TaxID=1176239 RepID=A0A917AZI7_HALAA|nr:hypothetical protein [Halobacillus andaensis]MBP2003627.1 hypothetical protein [Halobacillus andaensis]GGF12060.1 hypothetical protein GCM10010954_08380 [Halobacillus andaensis]